MNTCGTCRFFEAGGCHLTEEHTKNLGYYPELAISKKSLTANSAAVSSPSAGVTGSLKAHFEALLL